MNYVRKLGFEETPDYDFLRELFTKVLKSTGEQEDGIYDWNLLNGGKGWEACNVGYTLSVHQYFTHQVAQHTPGSVAATPHREHRRERDHGRRSRLPADGTVPNQLVVSPAPAHIKNSRRIASGGERNNLRDGSVQPLAPNSRRASQNKDISAGLSAPHPYAAAPSPTGYRNSPTPNNHGRHSPSNVLQSNGVNGSESVLYAQAQIGKNGSASRENTTLPGGNGRDGVVRNMGMYDREQMQKVGEQDEVHGGRRGFLSALCCRA